jgi:hypothetical protein
MKELIYLDTNFLHSFVAQLQDGLPVNVSYETLEEIRDEKELQEGEKSGAFIEGGIKLGELEIPLIFKSPTGQLKARLQPGLFSSEKINLSQLESGKEIISKQIHDNALNHFEKYLDENKLLFNSLENEPIGKVVKCKSNFKIVDIQYLKNIIQTDKLIEFMFMQQYKKLEILKEQVKNMPSSKEKNIQNAKIKTVEGKINEQKESLKEQFSFVKNALEYLTGILPTESFILMENLIAPLKNEFLREKSNELMFKYGGEESNLQITLIGKVTNKINKVELPDFSGEDALIRIHEIINAILYPIGVIKQGDFVVSPIAIYFE